MNILISACLLGVACRYDGSSRSYPQLLSLLPADCHLIPICPEQLGGLSTPRPASECKGHRVINALGDDVTAQYQKGAQQALTLARLFSCPCALLKARSPSCGSGRIYDGTFSKTLVDGNGVTAALLQHNGIAVFDESQLPSLFTFLQQTQ